MPVFVRYAAAFLTSLTLAGASFAADAKPAETKQPATPPTAGKADAKPAAPVKVDAGAKPQATAKPAAAPAPAPAKPVVAKPEAVKPAAAVKAAAPAKPAAPAVKPVSFKADIAPLLVKNCLACHGTNEAKGDYQLHTFTALAKPGSSGEVPFKPGKPEESELLRLLESEEPEERMPKEGEPLAKEQLALVRRWIAEGAKYDAADAKAELVAIIPRKPHPAAPEAYRVSVPVTALAFAPDGKELATGGYHEITVWNTADGKLLRRIKDVEQRTFGLAYSADGKLLAAAGGTPGVSGEAVLFDPVKGAVVRRLGTMSDVALGCAFSPDGKRLAVCSADRSIRVYDVASGAETLLIEDHADWVMTVAWSADGTKLVSGARDKTSKVFDAKTGDSLTTYPGHSETVLAAVFAPDGKTVLSGGSDKKIHVWNPADGKQSATITGFGGEVYRVVVVDGEIWSCSADKTAKRHKLADRALVQSLAGHADYVFSLAVHPATKRLATGSFDGEVKLWDTATNKPILSFRAAPGLSTAAK